MNATPDLDWGLAPPYLDSATSANASEHNLLPSSSLVTHIPEAPLRRVSDRLARVTSPQRLAVRPIQGWDTLLKLQRSGASQDERYQAGAW